MRKIVDEREARAFLKAARRAGLPLKAWARSHGIDGRSLNAWRLNLGRSGSDAGSASTLRLVELVPGPAGASRGRYTLRIGDVTIELGDDFREETLARLVRALRAC